VYIIRRFEADITRSLGHGEFYQTGLATTPATHAPRAGA
jgi:hypothetical protein